VNILLTRSSIAKRKWMVFFQHLTLRNVFRCVYISVKIMSRMQSEPVFFFPGSNASTKGVFGSMNYIWSEKMWFHMNTLEIILAMKFVKNLHQILKYWRQINTTPTQRSPLQSNQRTVKITAYLLHYYIYRLWTVVLLHLITNYSHTLTQIHIPSK
jgi:hypothetical protein